MGAGAGGNFGNTRGSTLDDLSNLLTAASLIPGIDTFVDLAAIPVDLARGDFLSAGLDALGVIPFVGEVADTAKLAKMADKAVDTAKAANKVSDFAKYPKKIHVGRQGKHIVGHNNYKKGRSIFFGSTTDAQQLIKNTVARDKGLMRPRSELISKKLLENMLMK